MALLGTIPPRGWSPESRTEAEYNRAVIALGRKLEFPVARIFEEIEAGGDRHRHISDDGVHWTGEGMAAAGRAGGRAMDAVRFALRD